MLFANTGNVFVEFGRALGIALYEYAPNLLVPHANLLLLHVVVVHLCDDAVQQRLALGHFFVGKKHVRLRRRPTASSIRFIQRLKVGGQHKPAQRVACIRLLHAWHNCWIVEIFLRQLDQLFP